MANHTANPCDDCGADLGEDGGTLCALCAAERADPPKPRHDYHEGRPIIRNSGRRVLVLCPYGHLYQSFDRKEWAGSMLEAKASDPNWTVRCCGALPKHLTTKLAK